MLDLTGSLSLEGSNVVIRYKVENYFSEAIFVANLPSTAFSMIYPNSAYCSLSPDEKYVNLLLGASPFPYDRDVEYSVGAFFMRVPQHDFMEDEIRLKVPLDEWSGYFTPHESVKTELVTVKKAVLHVEVIRESTVRWKKVARMAPDYWSISGETTEYKLSFPLKTPISVRKRSDDFPRP